MFARAHLRLTLLYVGLFALVLVVFSLIFYIGLATVLAPTFDLEPDLTSAQVAQAAYQAILERIGLALVIADLAIVALVGGAAWILASRTLRPIREALLRQRRFVADASHEMRTPLATIRAVAESATAEAEPADLRAALGTIATASARLSRLTTDLLLLAKTDDRLLDPRVEAFDLSVIVAEVVEAYRIANPNPPAPQLRLASDLRVRGDPDEVGRVASNLLHNAVEYGGAQAPVRVTTGASDREAWLEVSDEGPGIASADLERIFEPFYRVQHDAAGPKGSGLGLAIARSLAARNRGRLTVMSQPGSGATFRLTLPRFS